MKKGEIYEAIVEKVEFPNKGIVHVGEEKVIVKNAIPGQKIQFVINKKRNGKCEGRLLEVLEASELERKEGACPGAASGPERLKARQGAGHAAHLQWRGQWRYAAADRRKER